MGLLRANGWLDCQLGPQLSSCLSQYFPASAFYPLVSHVSVCTFADVVLQLGVALVTGFLGGMRLGNFAQLLVVLPNGLAPAVAVDVQRGCTLTSIYNRS